MQNTEDRKWLYEQLKDNGYDIGSQEEFEASLDNNEEDAKWYHEQATALGLEVGNYEDFGSLFRNKPAPKGYTLKEMKATTAPPMSEQYSVAPEPSSTTKTAEVSASTPESGTFTPIQIPSAPKLKYGDVENKEYLSPAEVTRQMMAEDVDHRQQVVDMTQRVKDELNRRGREIDAQGTSFSKAMQDAAGNTPAFMADRMADSEYRDYMAAQEALDNAQKAMDEAVADSKEANNEGLFGGFFKSAKRGLSDLDMNDFSFGIKDTSENLALLQALDAADEGKATSSQQALLDAAALEMATKAKFDSTSRGYKAGQAAGEAIPFMIEMAINPLSKVGKGVANRVARHYIKKYLGDEVLEQATKKGTKYAISRITPRVAQVAGDLAGAAGMAATTGLANVTADAFKRMQGDVLHASSKDGEIKYSGHTDGEDAATAFAKAYANTVFQNYSEMLGGYFAPLSRAAGKGISKGLSKIGLDKVNSFFKEVNATDIGLLVSDFERHAQWNGTLSEFAEEIAGSVLNAIFVGDQTLDTAEGTGVFNKDNLIDTYLGVALLGGGMSAVKTGMYPIEKYEARKNIGKAKIAFDESFGSADKASMEMAFNASDPRIAGNKLREIMNSEYYSDEQKRAAAVYAKTIQAYKGAGLMTDKRYFDPNIPQAEKDIEQSYENGRTLETPQEMNDAANMLELQAQEVRRLYGLGEDADIDAFLGENPLQKALDVRKTDEEAGQIILDYLNAKSTVDGVVEGAQDRIEEETLKATAIIDSRKSETDGLIHPAKMKMDDRQVYVISGNIALLDDGTINSADSDESIIVMDAATGKREFTTAKDLLSADAALDPEVEKQNVRATISDTISTEVANKLEGVLPFNIGDTYPVMDNDGNAHNVQVVAVDDQNTVQVIMDNEAQPTTVTKDIIQQMSNAYNLNRAAQFEQGRQEEIEAEKMKQEAEQVVEPTNMVEQTTEAPAEVVPKRVVPTLKDGNPDFNAMDAEMFVDEYVSRYGEDSATKIARKNISNARENIAKIDKKIDDIIDPNQMEGLYSQRNALEAQIARYSEILDRLGASEDANESEADQRNRLRNDAGNRITTLFPDGMPNVESFILADIATGNRIRWSDKVTNGVVTSRGLGAELGLSDSKQERTRRLPLIGKDAMTPDEYAESLRERLDAVGIRYDESSLRDAVLGVYQSVDSRKGAWDALENMSKKMQEPQTDMDWEDMQQQMAYNKAQNDDAPALPDMPDLETIEEEVPISEGEYREEVYNRQTTAKQPAEVVETSQSVESNGTQTPSSLIDVSTPKSSESKDTTTEPNAQEAEQKNVVEEYGYNGRSLTTDEAKAVINAMQQNAIVVELLELTPENWIAQFGEDGIIDTPIGNVKMGENQYFKLAQKGREGKLGMIKPTLQYPDIIVEEKSSAKNGQTAERNSSYVFVKAFTNTDGSRNYLFTSVTIRKDGKEVVISNQEKETPRIERLLKEGKLAYISEATLPSESTNSTQGNQSTILGGAILSESKDTTSKPQKQEVDEKISQEEQKVNVNPTDGQKEAGNYKKGHVVVDGFNITIEQPKGSVRSGVDADGKEWSITMNNTYGYIRGTEGVDGDHIDVFLSDNLDNWGGEVFVVDQINTDGSFDEHKVMYGFNSIEEAQQAYLSNYSEGWQGLGAITGVSKDEFKKWIASSHRKTKPFAEYKSVKATEGQSAESVEATDDEQILFRRGEKSVQEEVTETIFATAKEKFGTTYDMREAGYILPDGSMLDFSGKHEIRGADTSFLNGQRSVDHRAIQEIAYDFDENKTGVETDMGDFLDRGAIRIDYNTGAINLNVAPTKAQKDRLKRLIERNDGDVYIDFGKGWDTEHYVEYESARASRVLADIDRYFNEGIKPSENIRFRSAEPAPVFYSNAEYAVKAVKQEKATPEQWLKMIEKNGGLKAGEDKWLGLSDWLKSSDKKTLTKQEVLDFIKENQIQIEEVVYGSLEETPRFKELRNEYKSLLVENDYNNERTFEAMVDKYGEDFELAFEGWGNDLHINDYYGTEAADAFLDARDINDTRIQYTTDGLDNKREIALTVPTIESWNESDEIHFGDAGNGRAIAWVRFGETTDADGNRVLVIDEVQSKRHQEGREKGYNNPRVIEIFTRLADIESNLYSPQGLSMEMQSEREALKAELESIFENDNPVMKSIAEQLDKKESKRTTLLRERLEREDDERVEILKLQAKQDEVRNNRDYDYYESEIDKIKERIDQRNEELDLLASDITALNNEYSRYYNTEVRNARIGVSPAPFEKNWAELAMKRMLRYAAENGFDKIAWTTGEQQAERYDIGNTVDGIDVIPYEAQSASEIDGFDITIRTNNYGERIELFADRKGEIQSGEIGGTSVAGKHLSDIVGKPLANKIISNEGGVITDVEKSDSVKRADYANAVMQMMAKYNVSRPVDLQRVISANDKATLDALDPSYVVSARTYSGDGLRIGNEGMKAFYDQMIPSFMNKYGKKWGVKVGEVTMPSLEENNTMHSIDVTDAMRESVMQGQPMFRTTKSNFDSQFADLQTEYDALDKDDEQALNAWRDKKADVVRSYVNWVSDKFGLKCELYVFNGGREDEMRKAYDTMVERYEAKGIKRIPSYESFKEKVANPKVVATHRKSTNFVTFNTSAKDAELDIEQFAETLFHENAHRIAQGMYSKQEFEQIWENAKKSKNHIAKSVGKLYSDKSDAQKGNEFIAKAIGELVRNHKQLFTKFLMGKDDISAEDLVKKLKYSLPLGNLALTETLNKFKDEYQERVLQGSGSSLLGGSRDGGNIEVSEGDGGRNSRRNRQRESERLRAERGRDVVETATNLASSLGVKLNVIEDVNEITDSNARRQRAKRGAKAWYDVNTDQVYFVAPNATSIADAQESVLHEVVAHKGLRDVVGRENFNQFLSKIYFSAPIDVRRKIVDLAKNNSWNMRDAIEEYLASLAEKGFDSRENRTFWQKVRDFFMDMLREAKIVIGYNITDNDMRYMLWRTYQMQKSQGAMAIAEDVLMQQKMGVGNFRTRFIGEKGVSNLDKTEEATTRLDNLAIAREMEDAGKDAKTIKMATGWERGTDNKWRYEVNDAKLTDDWGRKANRVTGVKLADVVTDKELFNAYPELSDVYLSRETIDERGYYEPSTKRIVISDKVIVGAENVLNHEIQHAIQEIEGFTNGFDPKYFISLNIPTELEDVAVYGDVNVAYDLYRIREYAEQLITEGKYKYLRNAIKSIAKTYSTNGWFNSRMYNFLGVDNNTPVKDIVNYIANVVGDGTLEQWKDLPYIMRDVKNDAEDKYYRAAGEVEARNVARRMGMTADERRASLASETEDVAREDQIFIENSLRSASTRPIGTRQMTEEEQIIADAKANGTYLKAPNGKDTNLTPKQWVQVRTKAFKNWFGDWEYSPENASKIVDANGEPKVVYHGSVSTDITEFDKAKIRANETDAYYNGFWFSTAQETTPAWRSANKVYQVFLNLRNPARNKEANQIGRKFLKTDEAWELIGLNDIRSGADAVRYKLERDGYDGVIHFGKPQIDINQFNEIGKTYFETSGGTKYIVLNEDDGVNVYEVDRYEEDEKGELNTSLDKIEDIFDDAYFFGDETFVVFEPNQIKSATDNVGTFDSDNDDIRFRTTPKSADIEDGEEQIRDAFDRKVRSAWYQVKEAMYDNRQSVKEYMRMATQAHGANLPSDDVKHIEGYENPYIAIINKSSVNEKEVKSWEKKYYNRILNALQAMYKNSKNRVKELAQFFGSDSLDDIINNYLQGKHGLERNRDMAVRNALDEMSKATLITKQEAEQMLEQVNEELKNDIITPTEADARRQQIGNMLSTKKFTKEQAKIQTEAWNQRKKAIRENDTMSWAEKQRELDRIATTEFGVDLTAKDYSGLGEVFPNQDGKLQDSIEAAYTAIAEFEDRFDTEELWNAIRAANNSILEKSFRSGIINRATMDSIIDMYDYYIPLRGFEAATTEDVYGYLNNEPKAFSMPVKRANGRASKAEFAIPHILQMAHSAILQGNNNLAKMAFANFAQHYPTDLVKQSNMWIRYNEAAGVWEAQYPDIPKNATVEQVGAIIDEHNAQMEELAKSKPKEYRKVTGKMDVPYIMPKGVEHNHQIPFKRNGVDYVLTINGSPRLAYAMNGELEKAPSLLGKGGDAIEGFTRYLSGMYTQYNPDFMVSNALRDGTFVMATVPVRENAKYTWKFYKNYFKNNIAVMTYLFSKYELGELNLNNELEREFANFIKNGGETGYAILKDVEETKKRVSKDIHPSIWSKVMKLIDRLGVLGRGVESSARFAAYLTSREVGRSITRSAYDAKEVSVNFNRKGAGAAFNDLADQTRVGKVVGNVAGLFRITHTFFNAGVQGLAGVAKLLKYNPFKGSAALSASFLLGMIVASLYDDDDEDYYNLTETVRRQNIIIRAGEDYVSIPLAIELRAMYGLGEMAISLMRGKEDTTKHDVAHKIADQILQAFPINILEGNGGIEALLPTAATLVTDVMMNEDWQGMPIYREDKYPTDEFNPEWQMVNNYTGSGYIAASKFLSEATGGNEGSRGDIEINPAVVQHIAEGIFGGPLSFFDKVMASYDMARGKKDFEWRNVPFANRVIKDGGGKSQERAMNREYRNNEARYSQMHESEKDYEKIVNDPNRSEEDREKYRLLLEELKSSPDYERLNAFHKASLKIDKLYREYKASGILEDNMDIITQKKAEANAILEK